eukprot:CAMPEP_0119550810 /NCGR_PEP_ID=MMETSP1352-20130426/4261_1 /TAXON_ID=265584 /ORGANISM="Stauroneis constricta, Strain CCMP1120" /LENGTH=53 /DNA_ID=CAMNT_0007596775 /DNA_START=47 /DNA_END=204 /DNA_ORIENTATION=+
MPASHSTLTGNGRDLWFSVMGTGREMIASTCSVHTQFNSTLDVFSGTDCDSLS